MEEKQSKVHKGRSLSFLQRFEGRKATISKEGLLHLFDLHQGNIKLKERLNSVPSKEVLYQNDKEEKINSRQRKSQIIKGKSNFPKKKKQNASSKISNRSAIFEKKSAEESAQVLFFPKIVSRSNSSTSIVNSKNSSIKRSEWHIDKKQLRELQSKKLGFALSKSSESDTLENLHILNKLIEKLTRLQDKK